MAGPSLWGLGLGVVEHQRGNGVVVHLDNREEYVSEHGAPPSLSATLRRARVLVKARLRFVTMPPGRSTRRHTARGEQPSAGPSSRGAAR